MNRLLFFIVILIIWIGFYIILWKHKMFFFKFIWGSVGIFTIGMLFFLRELESFVNLLNTAILTYISNFTKYFDVYLSNQSITIDTFNGVISILINYECSGIIELMVYASLLLFFPFGRKIMKYINMVLGLVFIFIANILRILLIIIVTKNFGVEAYYVSHTVIARLFFFALMIIIYYLTFTKIQLQNQSIGDIK